MREVRRCVREDAWVREGGYVGMLAGMRKLLGNKAKEWGKWYIWSREIGHESGWNEAWGWMD